jgi:hypothetical protein
MDAEGPTLSIHAFGSLRTIRRWIAASQLKGASVSNYNSSPAPSRALAFVALARRNPLVVATTVASQLGVIFPTDIALAFLRDSNPSIRALTCACVRAGYEVVATLIAMLDDPEGEVSAAAACALGRMGRVEARIHLKRYFVDSGRPWLKNAAMV